MRSKPDVTNKTPLMGSPKGGIQVRRNLAIVALIIGGFLFLIIYFAIQPYLPAIGKVVFVIFLILAGLAVVLALAGFGTALFKLFSKIAEAGFSMQKNYVGNLW